MLRMFSAVVSKLGPDPDSHKLLYYQFFLAVFPRDDVYRFSLTYLISKLFEKSFHHWRFLSEKPEDTEKNILFKGELIIRQCICNLGEHP